MQELKIRETYTERRPLTRELYFAKCIAVDYPIEVTKNSHHLQNDYRIAKKLLLETGYAGMYDVSGGEYGSAEFTGVSREINPEEEDAWFLIEAIRRNYRNGEMPENQLLAKLENAKKFLQGKEIIFPDGTKQKIGLTFPCEG